MTRYMSINKILTEKILSIFLLFLMLGIGAEEAWGQESTAPTPKVPNGIYIINHNTKGTWYLWPSIVTNNGRPYLTTHDKTTADAVSGKYEAHSTEYCHWIVKNVTVRDSNYIQMINAKTGKYIIRRKFPKSGTRDNNAYGDRDVWLTDLPTDEDIVYSYFILANK